MFLERFYTVVFFFLGFENVVVFAFLMFCFKFLKSISKRLVKRFWKVSCNLNETFKDLPAFTIEADYGYLHRLFKLSLSWGSTTTPEDKESVA